MATTPFGYLGKKLCWPPMQVALVWDWKNLGRNTVFKTVRRGCSRNLKENFIIDFQTESVKTCFVEGEYKLNADWLKQLKNQMYNLGLLWNSPRGKDRFLVTVTLVHTSSRPTDLLSVQLALARPGRPASSCVEVLLAKPTQEVS